MTNPFSPSFKLALATTLLLTLSACASAPKVNYHYLLPAAQQVVLPGQTLPSVTVKLPDYLDQPGIVMRLNKVGMRAAHNHLWAAPLAQQLAHAMRVHLAKRHVNQGGKLLIRLVRFQGNPKGLATMAGSWKLQTADGRQLHGHFSRGYLIKDIGYDALVSELDRLWKGLAVTIAEQLTGTQTSVTQQHSAKKD